MRLRRGTLIKIMLSKGEPVVAPRQQINVNREENAAAIDKIIDHDRLVDRD
jgi:hypothetical protein